MQPEVATSTKGAPEEQQRKIEASGLAHLFKAIEIVPEKDSDTYLRFLEKHALTPATTW
ncbi:hypothetical protein ACI2L4_38610 [Streptomyces sparsogenes]|uniref:hypothetical protein n=1 Tax=Streptomyces sparsogenes TaxID=67365 RepID=UPI0033CB1E96